MHERICAGCGASLPESRGRKPFKWCSRKCRDAANPINSRGQPKFLDRERRCQECGGLFLAKDRRGRFCCSRCRERNRSRIRGSGSTRVRGYGVCEWCGESFTHGQSSPQRFCSHQCASSARRKRPVKLSSRIWVIDCIVCGKTVVARMARQRSCRGHTNAEYMLARYYADKAAQGDGRTPENWRVHLDRRNRRLRDQYVEDVSLSYIAERDGWRCHLCDRRVLKGRQWPHPDSASLDHIVPVSKGGEHSKTNVALAHLHCNLERNNKAVGEQLRLIG